MTKAPRPRHHYTRKPNLADIKTAGHSTLRLVNRRILLSLISDRQPISRAEIAKASGLNKATVSTITGDLLKDRYVVENAVGKTTSSGGKPPTPLRINELRYGLVGLDIRAGETSLLLSNLNAQIVARHSFNTGSVPRAFVH